MLNLNHHMRYILLFWVSCQQLMPADKLWGFNISQNAMQGQLTLKTCTSVDFNHNRLFRCIVWRCFDSVRILTKIWKSGDMPAIWIECAWWYFASSPKHKHHFSILEIIPWESMQYSELWLMAQITIHLLREYYRRGSGNPYIIGSR